MVSLPSNLVPVVVVNAYSPRIYFRNTFFSSFRGLLLSSHPVLLQWDKSRGIKSRGLQNNKIKILNFLHSPAISEAGKWAPESGQIYFDETVRRWYIAFGTQKNDDDGSPSGVGSKSRNFSREEHPHHHWRRRRPRWENSRGKKTQICKTHPSGGKSRFVGELHCTEGLLKMVGVGWRPREKPCKRCAGGGTLG